MFKQSASKTGSQADRETDDTDTIPTNITIELPMRYYAIVPFIGTNSINVQ